MQEAAAVAQLVVGWSSYLASIGYDVAEFRRELDQSVAYIKQQQAK